MDIFEKIKCPLMIISTREQWRKNSRFSGMLVVGDKANLDVEPDKELPNLSNAKMLSYVQKVKDSFLENYESYTGHFTSINFLSYYYFCGQVLQGVSERR